MSTGTDKTPMPDVAAGKDSREITIPRVGIRKLRMPCQVDGISELAMPTVAEFSLTVSLDAAARGTHMSRLVSIVDEICQSPVTLPILKQAVSQAAEALHTHSAQIMMSFPYFVCKKAPVTGAASLLDIDMQWDCQLNDGKYTQQVMLQVPVQSLCPCSKEISSYGAHSQRCIVTVHLDIAPDIHFIGIEQVIAGIEASASVPLYPVLKREDERFVTESAYDNPKFVEDILRDLVIFMRALPGITRFQIDVESVESIHSHNACASIEERSE